MQQTITKWIGTYINIMSYIAPGHAGKFGFRMFGRPIRRQIKPGEKQFLDSSEKFSFLHKGIKIQGYRWGSGSKKILLLHGWQSHAGRWAATVRALLPADYTVYAFDAPGHGLSEGSFFSAPLYGEVIMQFAKQTGRLHAIAGHSMGGFSTLYVLSRFKQPEADRLIIMATPGEVRDFVTHFRQRLGLNKRSLACIKNRFVKETGLSYDDFSISRFAERLDEQGLIIHDKTDRFAPFRYAEILNEKWAGSELVVTEGLGHHLNSEKVVNIMADFIGRDKVSGNVSPTVLTPN